MDINPDVKRLYAALKRLNIGQYIVSKDFHLFLIENNLDRDWQKIAKKFAIDRNISWYFFRSDNATFDELEEILLWFIGAKYDEEFDSFHELVLPLLLGFAKWSSTRLDYTAVLKHLKTIAITEENILKFAKDFRQIQGRKQFGTEETKKNTEVKSEISTDKVFIVHGHDTLAKTEVARFLENLGLVPIILHEQPSKGKTIIEKIEKYSDVGFGIVLYTPCDVGAAKEHKDHLLPRARQNVVFEHGYLIGRLGRERLCALVKGDVEKPNDISGVVYINMDDRGAWQMEVAAEMKECGYKIDINKLLQKG